MIVTKNEFTFIDLFAGIGGLRIPFEELGGRCVFSSEWDKYAQDAYEANFGERPQGDIKKIQAENIPDHDILLAGFPCQPFSIIGNGRGFADTRGTLFFEIERIIKAKEPKAFLLENVSGLVNHDNGRTLATILERLNALGYRTYWKILNALDFGLPQKRQRIIIVGFRGDKPFAFPQPYAQPAVLKDFLEPHEAVDKKYFASAKIVSKRLEAVGDRKIPVPSIWHENKAGNIGVHEYSCALRAGASYNYLLVDGIRRLTARECLNLQGFPKDFKIVVSDSLIRRQIGNSVPVNMIREVAKQMLKTLNSATEDEKEHEIYA